MQGEAGLIKQFQGALFVKIPDKYKADIINEYIEDQEQTYANWSMLFRQDLKEMEDSKMKMYCRALHVL